MYFAKKSSQSKSGKNKVRRSVLGRTRHRVRVVHMVAEGIIDSVISTFSSHERAGLSVITRDSLEKEFLAKSSGKMSPIDAEIRV